MYRSNSPYTKLQISTDGSTWYEPPVYMSDKGVWYLLPQNCYMRWLAAPIEFEDMTSQARINETLCEIYADTFIAEHQNPEEYGNV